MRGRVIAAAADVIYSAAVFAAVLHVFLFCFPCLSRHVYGGIMSTPKQGLSGMKR